MFTRTRKQTGTFIETGPSFLLRYYISTPDGPKKITVKLADKSPTIQTRADVEHLIEKELGKANGTTAGATVAWSLEDFVEQRYLPYVADNKAAVTEYSYRRLCRHVGRIKSARSRSGNSRPRKSHAC